MGLFRVPARLTGPTGVVAAHELLVDTGSTLLVIPQTLANSLGLVTIRRQPVHITGGRREIWPIAEVRLTVADRTITTPCFIAPGGRALLGAVALESLFLAVDPVARRLVDVEGFVGAASPRAPQLSPA
jgi:predicted aspartyl protease